MQLGQLVSVLALSCVCSCAATPPAKTYATPAALEAELSRDARTLNNLRPQLEELDHEILALQEASGWAERGYFSVAETDRISALLFRFTAAHSALWKITAAYQNMQTPFDASGLEARASVLSNQASLLLASHSAFLVSEFAGDPVAISKLNEAFPRFEISRDTFFRLAKDTSPQRLQRIVRAGDLLATERANSDSSLSQLAASDPAYAEMIRINASLLKTAEGRVRAALESQSSTEPEAVRRTGESIDNGLYVARSILFKNVSRLKSPTAHLIRFSDAQKAAIHARLRPGDLILTYTAGYTSDVFIPGAFKHGITFVGSPELRAQAGLRPDSLSGALAHVAPEDRSQLARHINQASIHNGKPADMIEAVAEGVIFNNLDHILDTHINRLLVLRPQLTESERRDFLLGVFSYLGEEYDFRFDFADSTRQVCTEVIYRAIQGKSGIEFDLTVRAGHETLSADDIALYFLHTHPEAFEFVLYVEEDPAGKDHQAIILEDEPGLNRLRTLMKSVKE